MFFEMLLLAAQAATSSPEASAKADELARKYFTLTCADGNEREGVVTVHDGVLYDVTLSGDPHSVTTDDDAMKQLCDRGALVVYHCHTTNDALSLFPSLDFDAGGSDFGSAAYLEYLCNAEAEKQGFAPPHIEYRLVHTGGSGTVVGYGVRGAVLEKARELGRESGHVSKTLSSRSSLYLSLSELLKMPQVVRAQRDALIKLYEEINGTYDDLVLPYLEKRCPHARTTEDLNACTALSIEAFAATLDPCGDYYIVPPGGAEPKPCTPITGERIVLEPRTPRYPNFTELTPDTYDSFTRSGKVMVGFCSESGGTGARRCASLLRELAEQAADCRSLKQGYVDLDRYSKLWEKYTIEWPPPEAILLEDGRRYMLNLRRPLTPKMFGLIVCGLDIRVPH